MAKVPTQRRIRGWRWCPERKGESQGGFLKLQRPGRQKEHTYHICYRDPLEAEFSTAFVISELKGVGEEQAW
jgi:hypothetical protein